MEIKLSERGEGDYADVVAFAGAYYYRRYGIQTLDFPDVIAFYTHGSSIIGCCGITCAHEHPKLTTEWYVSHSKIESALSPSKKINRLAICELGTLAVDKYRLTGCSERKNLVLQMTSTILAYARQNGVMFTILTGDRTMELYGKELSIHLHNLGEPDLCIRDELYRKKWQRYFDTSKRYCYGFVL